VGIRSCNGPASLSGLYVDTLPGIDLSWIDQIADDQQVTYQGVFNDLMTNALTTFRDDIWEEFSKRYLIKQITQQVDLGFQYDTDPLTPNAMGMEAGILLETTFAGSQVAQSNLLQPFVQNVSFFWSGTNGSPSYTITVYDADLNTQLYTVTNATAVAGWNTTWVNQQFAARRVYILVSGNFDNYVDLNISQFNLNNFGGIGWNWNGGLNVYWSGWACANRVNGATYNPQTFASATGANTYGVSAQISAKCTFDSLVCRNMQHFASAFQLLLAQELMDYRIYSVRDNTWTTLKLDQAKQMRRLFELKYRGGVDEATGVTYPGKLRMAIESIELNQGDCCLKSNDYAQSVETRF